MAKSAGKTSGNSAQDNIRQLKNLSASHAISLGNRNTTNLSELSSEALQSLVDEQYSKLTHATTMIHTIYGILSMGLDGDNSLEDGIPSDRVVDLARLRTAEAQLGFRLAHRSDVIGAVVATVRDLLLSKHAVEARSLSLHLISNRTTRNAGRICAAIVASSGRLNGLAKIYLDMVPEDLALKFASAEWYKSQFDIDPAMALRHFISRENGEYPSDAWLVAIRFGLTHGFHKEVLLLCQRFFVRSAKLNWATKFELRAVKYIENFLLSQSLSSVVQIQVKDAVGKARIAIWENHHPDIAGPSADLGPYIESLVLIERISRSCNLHSDDSDLNDFFSDVIRIPRDEGRRTIDVMSVNRYGIADNSSLESLWTVYHGTFDEKIFGVRHSIARANYIKPIFWGFHLNQMTQLAPDDVTFLMDHGPVGCRDLATTFTLLGLGIDAFHSGAIASLIDAKTVESLSTVTPIHEESDNFTVLSDTYPVTLKAQQKSSKIRSLGLAANLTLAGGYLRSVTGGTYVVTPHLETYLVTRRLELPVLFQPKGRPVDAESESPYGHSTEIQAGPDALDSTLNKVLAGASVLEIQTHWRNVTATMVEEARRRFRSVPPLPEISFSVEEVIAELQLNRVRIKSDHARSTSSTVHVAMACDRNLFGQLATAITSIRDSTSRDLHIHVLSRDLDADDFEVLCRLHPSVDFDFVKCDKVDYGDVMSHSSHITVSTIDRLLLPSLLDDIDQVVYLDIDLLVLDDIGKLFDLKMKDLALAACSATADWSKSGFGHLITVANRLGSARSEELKHEMQSSLGKDFTAYNAGVMVLNLRKMRLDSFCSRFLGCPEYFDMNDQDVLYLYTGSNRRELHPSWNCIPSHVYVTRPKIVHWAGPAKPWNALRMPYQNAWLEMVAKTKENANANGIGTQFLDDMTIAWP